MKSSAIKIKTIISCKKRNAIVSPLNEEENPKNTDRRQPVAKEISFSAILNTVMTFYQLKALVTVKITNDTNSNALIERFFNIELIYKGRVELDQLCAFHGATVVTKEIFKGYGVPLIMVLTVGVFLIISNLYQIILKDSSQSTSGKFYIGYYAVLAFCYKDICQTAFSLINCKTMNGKTFLYIDGSIEC